MIYLKQTSSSNAPWPQAIPHHLGIKKHWIIVRHNLLSRDQSDLTGLFQVLQLQADTWPTQQQLPQRPAIPIVTNCHGTGPKEEENDIFPPPSPHPVSSLARSQTGGSRPSPSVPGGQTRAAGQGTASLRPSVPPSAGAARPKARPRPRAGGSEAAGAARGPGSCPGSCPDPATRGSPGSFWHFALFKKALPTPRLLSQFNGTSY